MRTVRVFLSFYAVFLSFYAVFLSFYAVSVVKMMSVPGLSPAVSMEWSEFGSYDLSECVPALLRRAGYGTAIFTGGALSNHVIRPGDIDAMGFERAVGFEQVRFTYRND